MREDLPCIELVAGEFGFPLELSLVDVDNAAVSLAVDDTVSMSVRRDGSATSVAVGTGSVYSAVGGVVRITLGSGDVAKLTAGRYAAMVTVSTGSAKVVRSLPFWIVVYEAVAA